jgi:hypothetical protein
VPLKLGDLAPFLTPYRPVEGIDLSGVATQLSHNYDRDQAMKIAEMQNATNLKQLAEEQRSNKAREQAVIDAAKAAADKAQHEEEMKLVGQVPGMVDPMQERALLGQMASAGMGLQNVETPDVPFAPGLTVDPVSAPLPSSPKQMKTITPEQEADFQGFLKSATAPAAGGAPDEQPLGFSPDELHVMGKDGTPLTKFSPEQARDRARRFLNSQVEGFLKKTPAISMPVAKRVREMSEGALAANGYDPEKAMAFLVDKTFTPEMKELYALERAETASLSASNRFGVTQDLRKEGLYLSTIKDEKSSSKFAAKTAALDYLNKIDSGASSDNAFEQRTAIANHIHMMTGAAQSNAEDAWVKQSAGLIAQLETTANLLDGGKVSPALLKGLRANAKKMRAVIERSRDQDAKSFAARVARNPTFGPAWRERAYADFIGSTASTAPVTDDGGMNYSGSTSVSGSASGESVDDLINQGWEPVE